MAISKRPRPRRTKEEAQRPLDSTREALRARAFRYEQKYNCDMQTHAYAIDATNGVCKNEVNTYILKMKIVKILKTYTILKMTIVKNVKIAHICTTFFHFNMFDKNVKNKKCLFLKC